MMHPVIRNAATILAETPDSGPATGWVVAAAVVVPAVVADADAML